MHKYPDHYRHLPHQTSLPSFLSKHKEAPQSSSHTPLVLIQTVIRMYSKAIIVFTVACCEFYISNFVGLSFIMSDI